MINTGDILRVVIRYSDGERQGVIKVLAVEGPKPDSKGRVGLYFGWTTYGSQPFPDIGSFGASWLYEKTPAFGLVSCEKLVENNDRAIAVWEKVM
jgi:hypothetical protein